MTVPFINDIRPITCCGPGSVVGIATGYGLDVPGIDSRWGQDFPHPSRPASCTMGTGSFPGVKSGRGVTLNPHPLLVPLVNKRVELYLYSPYGSYSLYRASVPVQRCTLPFTSTCIKHYRKQLCHLTSTKHNCTSAKCILTEIHWFLVINNGQSSFLSPNHFQGQIKTPQSVTVLTRQCCKKRSHNSGTYLTDYTMSQPT
jgi:hypothetical protein